jgi:hypothetical protein
MSKHYFARTILNEKRAWLEASVPNAEALLRTHARRDCTKSYRHTENMLKKLKTEIADLTKAMLVLEES